MSAMMKALVYEGPKIMEMRSVPVPVPKSDEVLIRVEQAGICGSELSGYLGHNSLRKPPLIMGHEFSGTIEASGGDAARFHKGDRVTVNPLLSCGSCSFCIRGNGHLCPSRKLLGAALPGAFAEWIVAPARNVYRLEDHVSFEEGAMAEPFAVAVHITELLRLSPDDRLLIVGAGPIGMLVLQAARQYGVTDIAVLDINPERLEIIREIGGLAAESYEALPEEWTKAGFDAAVDAVGLGATRRQCINAVRAGGKVVFSGLHEADSTLPVNTAVRNEIQMTGAFAYSSADFERALHWIGKGKMNMLPWTVKFPLEQGAACFERLLGAPGKIAKILLTLRES
ncbi:galactitol-1-phosphate 5-dehydrogenase [Paenibacillus sp. MBLB4367]|uniref:galactitol-1-phosphate 5-dehydrogenase n=1 Tax=Paenibacillus sp. MBLB4367 TaxID=3384767 RepID=UPI003907E9D0